MRHIVAALTAFGMLVVGSVSVARAQSMMQAGPPDRMAVEKAIMANEQKIMEAFAKKDIATMKMYIADDAAGGDPMGFTTIADTYKQLPTMDIKVTSQASTNFRYHWVDPNTVIVTYQWSGKGTMMGQPIPSPVHASTVWTKRGTKWVAVFHQETPAMPMPAAPAKK